MSKKAKNNTKVISPAISSKLSSAFSFILSPFQYFKYKSFYFFWLLDMFFIISLIYIGKFSENLTPRIASIGSALFAAFIIFMIVFVSYSVIKYYFYKLLNEERSLATIAWKHLAVAITLSISTILTATLFRMIIINFFRIQYVRVAEILALGAIFLFSYLLFINYHNHDQEKIIQGIKKAMNNLFSKITLKVAYADFIFIFIAYILFNIIAFIFRLLYLRYSDSLAFLNLFFNRLEPIFLYGLIITILVVNKLIIYNVKLENLK